MHLPRADLHLEGDTGVADDGGVEGLIQVGLGGGDVVLEPARHRVVHIVDEPQHVVALPHIVHDDAEGAQVEDLSQRLLLGEHFAVNRVDVLDPAGDGAVDALLLQPVLDVYLGGHHELLVPLFLLGQGVLNLLIADGVQVFQGQVLQLPLDALHTQPVSDGGVDLQGLPGLFPLFLRRLILHRAHIVQPVAELDQDDPDVLAHGHEHLAQILHLLLFHGHVVDSRQLGDPLHQIGDGGGELPADVLVGALGVLNAVVEQSGTEGVRVQLQVGHDVGYRQRVGDVGGTILSGLSLMGFGGVAVRLVQKRFVQSWIVGQHVPFQFIVVVQHRVHKNASFFLAPVKVENRVKRPPAADAAVAGWWSHSSPPSVVPDAG